MSGAELTEPDPEPYLPSKRGSGREDLPAHIRARIPKVDGARVYQEFLSGKNKSTISAYRRDLEAFAKSWGVGSAQTSVETLLILEAGEASAVVRAYKREMIEAQLAPSTINRRLSALRSVVKLGNELGVTTWSLAVPGIKVVAYRDTSGPELDTVKRILSHLEDKEPSVKNRRDEAMINLLFSMALRRNEVVSLNMKDVDFDRSRIMVLGKGRSEPVWITAPKSALRSLARWIAYRGTDAGPLFISQDPAGKGDGRLTNRSLGRVVRTVGEELGIELWPHALRHSAITAALDATDGNYRKVRGFSRHKNMNTVAIYDDNRRDFAGEVAESVSDLLGNTEDPGHEGEDVQGTDDQ